MASVGQLARRYLYLWMFTDLPLAIAGWLTGMRFAFVIDITILALVAISRLYFVFYFINVVLRRGKLMPHDRLSGTLYMATELPDKSRHHSQPEDMSNRGEQSTR